MKLGELCVWMVTISLHKFVEIKHIANVQMGWLPGYIIQLSLFKIQIDSKMIPNHKVLIVYAIKTVAAAVCK